MGRRGRNEASALEDVAVAQSARQRPMHVTVDTTGPDAGQDGDESGPTDREKVKGGRRRRRKRSRLGGESDKDLTQESPASHDQVGGQEYHRNQQDQHARHHDYLMRGRTRPTALFAAERAHASVQGRSHHLLSGLRSLCGSNLA
jgi:hypothetical protein